MNHTAIFKSQILNRENQNDEERNQEESRCEKGSCQEKEVALRRPQGRHS
jgi:hypothetical protein